MTTPDTPPKAGDQVGRYVFLRDTATGPLGPFWEARVDTDGESMDALARVIILPHGIDAEQQQSLTEAAWDSTELCHDGVIGVADVIFGKQWLALVHDYTEGTMLRSLLLRAVEHSSAFDPAVVVRMALDIVSSRTVSQALSQSAGISWRFGGISATSAMLCGDGFVRLLDGCVPATATRLGSLRVAPGALAYVAPEQLAVECEPDARADVFSLGIIVWELLSGQVLLTGSQAAVAKRLSEPIPRLAVDGSTGARVPDALANIIARALELDPAMRFATLNEFGAAMKQALPGSANRGEVIEFVDTLLRRESTLFRLLADPAPRLTEHVKSVRPAKPDLAWAADLAAQAKIIAKAQSQAARGGVATKETPATEEQTSPEGAGPDPLKTAAASVAAATAARGASPQSGSSAVQAGQQSAAAVAPKQSAAAVIPKQSAAAVAPKQSAAAVAPKQSAAAVVPKQSAAAVVPKQSAAAVVPKQSALTATAGGASSSADTGSSSVVRGQDSEPPPARPQMKTLIGLSATAVDDLATATADAPITAPDGADDESQSSALQRTFPGAGQPQLQGVRITAGRSPSVAESPSLPEPAASADRSASVAIRTARVAAEPGGEGALMHALRARVDPNLSAEDTQPGIGFPLSNDSEPPSQNEPSSPAAQASPAVTSSAGAPAVRGRTPLERPSKSHGAPDGGASLREPAARNEHATAAAPAASAKPNAAEAQKTPAQTATVNGAKRIAAEAQNAPVQAAAVTRAKKSAAVAPNAPTQTATVNDAKKLAAEAPEAPAKRADGGATKRASANAPRVAGEAAQAAAAKPILSESPKALADAIRAAALKASDTPSGFSGSASTELLKRLPAEVPESARTEPAEPDTLTEASGVGKAKVVRPPDASAAASKAAARPFAVAPPGGIAPSPAEQSQTERTEAEEAQASGKAASAQRSAGSGAGTRSARRTVLGLGGGASIPRPTSSKPPPASVEAAASSAAAGAANDVLTRGAAQAQKPEPEAAAGPRAAAPAEETHAVAETAASATQVAEPTTARRAEEPQPEQAVAGPTAEPSRPAEDAEPKPAGAVGGEGSEPRQRGPKGGQSAPATERTEARSAPKSVPSAFDEFLESDAPPARGRGSRPSGGASSSPPLPPPPDEPSRPGTETAAARVDPNQEARGRASAVAALLSETIDRAGMQAGAPTTTTAEPVTNLLDGVRVAPRGSAGSSSTAGSLKTDSTLPLSTGGSSSSGVATPTALGAGAFAALGRGPTVTLRESSAGTAPLGQSSSVPPAPTGTAAAVAPQQRPVESQVRAIVVAASASSLDELDADAQFGKKRRVSWLTVFFGLSTFALAGVVVWLLRSKPEAAPAQVVAPTTESVVPAVTAPPPSAAPAETAPVANAPAPTDTLDAGAVSTDAGATAADAGDSNGEEESAKPTENAPKEEPARAAVTPVKRARTAATRPVRQQAAKQSRPQPKKATPAPKKKSAYVPDDL